MKIDSPTSRAVVSALFRIRQGRWLRQVGAIEYVSADLIEQLARAAYAAWYGASGEAAKKEAFVDRLERDVSLQEALIWGCWLA